MVSTLVKTRWNLKETQTFKAYIKLNHTNIALLLQEATQKYRKLADYRTKCCYLSLLFSLLSCDVRFLRLPQRQGIFSS